MNNDAKGSWLSALRINVILKVYLWVYGIALGISGILLLLSAVLLLSGQATPFLNVVVVFLGLVALFFGISHKKSWIPITVTILSALGFLSILLLMISSQPPPFNFEATKIIYYCLLPLIGLWQLFTLYLFNTKEVKTYFKTSGLTVY